MPGTLKQIHDEQQQRERELQVLNQVKARRVIVDHGAMMGWSEQDVMTIIMALGLDEDPGRPGTYLATFNLKGNRE